MDQTAERQRWRRIATILDVVLELPPDERGPYLDRVCGGDSALQRELEELLAATAASDEFLDTPALERAAPLVAVIDRDNGTSANFLQGRVVGPYRLLAELGEGGMGVVYLADRIDGQFEQQVAVKLVKQGLISEEARRRFLQERQILARLQHPAIARLLDGGVTAEGTPFFVMERVEGQPVTSYCSEHALKTEDRLRIFLQICEPVQYAHRNLIVHRDLKPSNILVDDGGRVKLLDFGIAKLLGDGDSAIAGSSQSIVRALTPDYAAPEQLRGESVSTSTDVYALGVLLYELLTGERPYRLRSGVMGELERAILDQVPSSPSARAGSGDLRRRLKGDLDRIVLKALQKSPERRYPSAEAFATDVRRHLEGLPVSARGDALSYRAWKFLGRHRVSAAVAALLMLTLVGGLLATTSQARRAEREARKADAVKDFLKTLLSAANPELVKGREPSVRELLDDGARRIDSELHGQPDVQSEVAGVMAEAYQALGEYDGVAALLRADLDRRRRSDGPHSIAVAGLLRQIADALYEQSRYDEAGTMYADALAIQREKRGERSPEVAELLWDIAGVMRNRGDLSGAEAYQKQSLAIYVATNGDDSRDAAAVRESLAITYTQSGRFPEAAGLMQPVATWRERHLGQDHPNTLVARYNVAYVLQGLGQFEEAARISEDVVARQRRVLGTHHDRLAVSLRLLARALDGSGRSEAAMAPIAEALTIHLERFGDAHLQVAHDRAWQALVEAHTGRLREAEHDCLEAQRIFDAQQGQPRADLPYVRMWIGIVLGDVGRLEQAEAVLARAVSDLRVSGPGGPFLGLALDALGDVARRRGQPLRARDLAREALPIVERGLGADHEATAVASVHAGAAEWRADAPAAGEPYLRAGLAKLEKQFPGGHPDLASAKFILGDALRNAGRHIEARPLLQDALSWRQNHFGPTDPRTLETQQALKATKP
jgi:serine/threonine-protein kinase